MGEVTLVDILKTIEEEFDFLKKKNGHNARFMLTKFKRDAYAAVVRKKQLSYFKDAGKDFDKVVYEFHNIVDGRISGWKETGKLYKVAGGRGWYINAEKEVK